MKKLLQWLAVCVFACLVFIPALAQAQTVPTTITSFRVTDKNKQDLTSAYTNQDIYLTASWSATGEVHEGDTFSLGIPDILDFPATNAASFNIYAPDGNVMATAQVTPGRVTITYTSWAEGKDHVYSNIDPASWVRINVPEPVINGSGFTLDLSSVDFQGNQYFMYYETEGTETTSNSIQLKSRETTQSSRYQYVNQDSGGNGNGDNRPQPTEPETPPTPEPNPGPRPQPTPEESDPEPQPEPAKPAKKTKKKAVLPATGDFNETPALVYTVLIAAFICLATYLGAMLQLGGKH